MNESIQLINLQHFVHQQIHLTVSDDSLKIQSQTEGVGELHSHSSGRIPLCLN